MRARPVHPIQQIATGIDNYTRPTSAKIVLTPTPPKRAVGVSVSREEFAVVQPANETKLELRLLGSWWARREAMLVERFVLVGIPLGFFYDLAVGFGISHELMTSGRSSGTAHTTMRESSWRFEACLASFVVDLA